MANANLHQSSAENDAVILADPARRELITQATWQMEPILNMLIERAERQEDDFEYLLRGILPRLLQLNDAIMAAAGSADLSVESIHRKIFSRE